MTHDARPSKTEETGGYTVRAPRVTDAIGKALRRVFHDDARLPEEIALALRRLDRVRH